MSNLSLFEIAQNWKGVSNEDVNHFKDSLNKEFPDVPRGPITIQWTPPGHVKLDCTNCTGMVSMVNKYWLVFPLTEDVYTINKENKFAKVDK